MKKRILSLLLVLTILMTMLPVSASAEVLEGDCGKTCNWTLDTDTGVLKIIGVGAIESQGSGSLQPWYPYRASITEIVIADGITEIPRYAFEYLNCVETVRLPDTLEYLACNAFNNCAALNDLVIPASVLGFTDSGNFNRCTALTDIWYVGTRAEWEQIEGYANAEYYKEHTIRCLTLHEDSLTCLTHGKQPFYAYDGTANTVLYDQNKKRIACPTCGISVSGTCGEDAFWSFAESSGVLTIRGTGAMEDYTIGSPAPWSALPVTRVIVEEGVTAIGMHAFEGLSDLRSAALPQGLTTLGYSAFRRCSSLSNIKLPDTLTTIFPSALEGTAPITITIPASVAYIGEYAFLDCQSLQYIYFEGDVPVCVGCDETTLEPLRTGSLSQIFYCCKATVYYPVHNETWTAEVRDAFCEANNGTNTQLNFVGNHPWSDATCTEASACTVCGIVLGEPLGHSGTWTTTKIPTCYSEGEMKRVCTVCGTTETKTLDIVDHEPVDLPAIEPTCTKPGMTAGKECDFCRLVMEGLEEVPARGHVGAWTTTKIPTCYSEGEMKRVCTVCGTTETKTLDIVDHEPVDLPAIEPTCTKPGMTAGKQCDFCGLVMEGMEEVPAAGHSETTIAGKDATCTATGLTEGKKCTVCGEITVKQTVVPVKGHTEKTLPAQAAACTTAGLTEGKKCTVCGETTLAQQTIPALGHTETTVAGKDATCTAAGLTEGKKCTVCGEITVPQQTVPVKGHTEKILPAQAAACTTAGLTEGKKCTVCGVVTVPQQTVPAMGHADKDKNSFCDRCSTKLDCMTHEEETLPGKAATCTADGLTEGKKCTVCGEITVKQTVIPATGHTETTVAGKDATCTAVGLTEGKKCTVCGTVTVRQTTVPAKGHSWNGSSCAVCGVSVPFAGGSGTMEDPYQISTKVQLNEIRNFLSSHFILINDIEFTAADFQMLGKFFNMGKGWLPIGDGGKSFTGTLDGRGHTIRGLTTLNSSTSSAVYQGLFYQIGEGAVISNLMMEDFSASGRATLVGGIAAYNYGTIDHCGAAGTINTTKTSTASSLPNTTGIVGINRGTISNSMIYGKVTINGASVDPEEFLNNTAINIGTVVNSYGLGGSTGTYIRTEEQFASGEVAYLLGETWGQNIDNGKTNLGYPVLGGAKVYLHENGIYSNSAPHIHTPVTDAAVDPTCIEPGLTEGSHCSGCGEVLVPQQTVIPATGHTEKTLPAQAAACTAAGLTEGKQCTVCGVVTVPQQTVPAVGHTEKALPAQAATCTAAGLTEGKQCTVCGEITVKQQTVPAAGHKEQTLAAKAATCTETGLTEGKKCTVCGVITLAQQIIPAKGHKEATIAGQAATCTETGLTYGMQCSVCGVITVQQQILPAVGHTDDDRNSLCDRCGTKLNCVTHEEETIPGQAATCTAAGLTEGKQCKVCGEITVKQTVIPAKGHAETAVPGKTATCVEPGLTEGKKCTVCGEITVKQTVIPATGHTEKALPAQAATCTAAGLTEGKKCTVCGEITVKQTVIPAAGHTEKTLPGQAATCTASGLTEGKQCTTCGVVTVVQQTIPAAGHADKDKNSLCDRCGTKLDCVTHEEALIPGKAATCTASGLTEGKKCTVCGEITVKQQTIPAAGHKEQILAAKAATCTATGLTEGKKCTVCGVVTVVQQTVAAKGHSFGQWETVKEPSGSEPGEERRVCTACGHTETNRLTAGLKVVLSSASGTAGSTVKVNISLQNNPGIIGARLALEYDTGLLELVDARDTGRLKGAQFGNDLSASPFLLVWEDSLAKENNTNTGVIAELTFRIRKDCPEGMEEIRLTAREGEIFDKDIAPIPFSLQNGKITITDSLLGDVNRDGRVSLMDATVLRRYLAGWAGYTARPQEADANSDGEVGLMDVTILRRYLAGWSGVVLGQQTPAPVSLQAENASGVFRCSDVTGRAGETVTVDVVLEDNPGIIAAILAIDYDPQKLQLTAAEDTKLLADGLFGNELTVRPYQMVWEDALSQQNNTETGVVARLTFTILEDCLPGETTVTVRCDEAYNTDIAPVDFRTENGTVTVTRNEPLPAEMEQVQAEGKTVTLQIESKEALASAWIWCAVYDEDDRFVTIVQKPVDLPAGASQQTVALPDDLTANQWVKAFLLGGDHTPHCEAKDNRS